jgi:hypothetical protein
MVQSDTVKQLKAAFVPAMMTAEEVTSQLTISNHLLSQYTSELSIFIMPLHISHLATRLAIL